MWPVSKNSLAVKTSVTMSAVGRKNEKKKKMKTILKCFHFGLLKNPVFSGPRNIGKSIVKFYRFILHFKLVFFAIRVELVSFWQFV